MVDVDILHQLIKLDPSSLDKTVLSVLFGLAVEEFEQLGLYLESAPDKNLNRLEQLLDDWLDRAQDFLD